MPFQPGAPVTVDDATAQYIQGASSKSGKWKDRVLKPRRLFTDAAIAQSGHWLNRVNEAGTAGFENGMRRVDMNMVAANIEKSGAAAYTTGIQNKSPKYKKAMQGLLPVIQQAAANLPARGDLEQNIARSAAMQRAMAAVRGQHRG